MSKQITKWRYVGDDKMLLDTKYGFITHKQWLLKEQERFKKPFCSCGEKMGIPTTIRRNPDNKTEEALFYLHLEDVPHYDTPAEMRSSLKNDEGKFGIRRRF